MKNSQTFSDLESNIENLDLTNFLDFISIYGFDHLKSTLASYVGSSTSKKLRFAYLIDIMEEYQNDLH